MWETVWRHTCQMPPLWRTTPVEKELKIVQKATKYAKVFDRIHRMNRTFF
jgi:hypothetical protein